MPQFFKDLKDGLAGVIRVVYNKRQEEYGARLKGIKRSADVSKWFLGGLSALFFFSYERIEDYNARCWMSCIAFLGIISFTLAFFRFGRLADKMENKLEAETLIGGDKGKRVEPAGDDEAPVGGVKAYDVGIACLITYTFLYFFVFDGKAKSKEDPVEYVANYYSYADSTGSTLSCKDCPGFTFSYSDIQFDFNKAEIKKAAFDELDSLARMMNKHPGRVLLISAHTDSIGNMEDNLALSRRRAEAVKVQLVKRGVDGSRLQTRGYSEIAPLMPNDSEHGRLANRRAEFTILRN